jgi:hypothetical protein
MSYLSGVVDRFFFVRWQQPELHDIPRIIREVAKARESVGKPLVYIAIAPEDSPAPDDNVRKAMMDAMEKMLEQCETLHFVFEGKGFSHTIKRSALTSILLASGKRGKVFVNDSVEDALATAPGRLRIEPATILRVARARGLVV